MFSRSRLCGLVTEAILALVWLELVSGQNIHMYEHMEYGERLKEIAEAAERTIGAEVTWQQITNDYPQIMEATRLLYWTVQTDVIDNTHDKMVVSAGYALRQELKRNLILRNAEILANSMSLKESLLTSTRACEKMKDHLLRNYELEVVEDIFTMAIDELYELKGVEHLSTALEMIKRGSSDYGTMELYAHARLHLFWKFMKMGDVNDQYMLEEARYMQHLRDKHVLGPGTERRVEIAISHLPTPLVRVSTGESFCLRNIQYNYLMYMSGLLDVARDRGWVFLWGSDKHDNTESWQLHNKTEYDGAKKRVQHAFWSPIFKQYMYMATDVENEKNVIVAARNGKIHPNSYWDMESVGNKIVFKQNGYIMCASDKKYDLSRNKIYGYKDKTFTESNPACQWIGEECNF